MHLLSLGNFYLEYVDAIKEGDGQTVLRCWKHISQSSGHTNYSIEVMNILCQCKFKLAPRQSAELLYNRFVNVHSLPGMNIPADLHQEYLNRVCKDAVFGLGVNKTEKSIGQVGKALGTLSTILNQYDHVNGIPWDTQKPTSDKDRNAIVKKLQDVNVFVDSDSSHEHPTFKNPRDI